ncbi:MAG: hypothetical protein KJ025_15150, partial [Burkholderiales bacterium]|nr:hypothetical protein [Burkholderiales bacterium]
MSGEEYPVVAIGARARAALERSDRRAEALAAFPGAPYLRAGGEVIWVSHRLPAAHPRAVQVGRPLAAERDVRFGVLPEPDPQACALPAATRATVSRPRAPGGALAAAPAAVGAPRGRGWLPCRPYGTHTRR